MTNIEVQGPASQEFEVPVDRVAEAIENGGSTEFSAITYAERRPMDVAEHRFSDEAATTLPSPEKHDQTGITLTRRGKIAAGVASVIATGAVIAAVGLSEGSDNRAQENYQNAINERVANE